MHRAFWLMIVGGAVVLLGASSSEPRAPLGRDAAPGDAMRDQAQRERSAADRPPFRFGPGLWRGEGGRHDWSLRLSPEDTDRLLDLAQQIDPQRGDRLRRMRQDDPDGFKRWAGQSGRRLAGLLELQQRQPALFAERLCELRAEASANRLARQWQAARDAHSTGDMQRLERELRAAVAQQVECGIKARTWEIVLFEEHLQNLRRQLEQDARDEGLLVDRRVTDLLAADPDRPRQRSVVPGADDDDGPPSAASTDAQQPGPRR